VTFFFEYVKEFLNCNEIMEFLDQIKNCKFFEVYLTLRLLMSYIYGAPSKARNANVIYIWTYVWQR